MNSTALADLLAREDREEVERWMNFGSGSAVPSDVIRTLELLDDLWTTWEQERQDLREIYELFLRVRARSAPSKRYRVLFAQKWAIHRDELADLVGRNIHTVNHWFSGGDSGKDMPEDVKHRLRFIDHLWSKWQRQDEKIHSSIRVYFDNIQDTT